MLSRNWLVACAASLALVGCATGYGDMGFTGGVRADQLSETTFRITAMGNGYTSTDRMADFALRKAAEQTLASGYEWFGVLSSEDRSSTGYSVNRSPTYTTAQVSTFGNTAYGTATTSGGGTSVSSYVKPGTSMIIELGRGPRPAGAHDAAETLRFVVPRTEDTLISNPLLW